MSTYKDSEIPPGKYNKWCERRPLVCSDEKRKGRADAYLRQRDLTQFEKAAFYAHELIGCEGLEFVAFSNAYLKEPILLPGNIRLVPCFLPDINGCSLKDPLAHFTMQMQRRSRFIYDGWLPISDWRTEAVKERIRQVEGALSVLALLGRINFSREPKYMPIVPSEHSSYHFERGHLEEVNQLSHLFDSFPSADAKAILRSIAWLSQSLRLSEYAAQFLFSILAIESLAIYIEE